MPSDPLSRQEMDAALALANAATPGPWERHGDTAEHPPMVWDSSGDSIVSRMPDGRPYFEPEDAAFIAASRDLVPRLVDEVMYWRERWARAELDLDCRYEDCGCIHCNEARAILAEKEKP